MLILTHLRPWQNPAAALEEAAQPAGCPVLPATKRGNTIDIRWATIGMIQEYARHNGHADILRELIDGKTGE